MAAKYWKTGLGEMWRSVSKAAFVKALQRLVPEIRAEHLHAAPAGIRAQAVSPDGSMVDDFLIQESRPRHQRQQRPVAGRDRLAQHRQDDRRAAGPQAHLTRSIDGTVDHDRPGGDAVLPHRAARASSPTRVFRHFGVPEADARQAADVLATSDLRGIDSHGVARLHTYFDMLTLGRINPRPEVRIVRQTARHGDRRRRQRPGPRRRPEGQRDRDGEGRGRRLGLGQRLQHQPLRDRRLLSRSRP